MIDHHVDRPDVQARQRAQLTGPNRPTGSKIVPPSTACIRHPGRTPQMAALQHETRTPEPNAPGSNPGGRSPSPHGPQRPGMGRTTWWPWRGARTRSHPELGRENPQRPWYCAPRHGRVGRRQVLQPIPTNHTHAGWSSPVARQAHNLKAAGSNPAPATTSTELRNKPRSCPDGTPPPAADRQFHHCRDLAYQFDLVALAVRRRGHRSGAPRVRQQDAARTGEADACG